MSRSAEHLNDIRAFIEVARSGGFLRAAEHLSRTGSAVSKAVQRLEDQLGVRLLLRTTRHVSLTEEGRNYLQECERALASIEAAGDAVIASRGAANGLLRIQIPQLWGRETIVAALPRFRQAYPDIELQLFFSELGMDLLHAHIDIGFCVGTTEDSTLVTKPLLSTHSWIVGSPSYIERFGTPASPNDLQTHDCIHFLQSDTFRPTPWHFLRSGKASHRVFRPGLTVNDPHAMRDAAIVGLGLVQGPDFLFADALRRGQLKRVLEQWESPGPTICLIWPQNRYISRRARVFIDWVGELTK